MEKKKYIIVGDNNFWYYITKEVTLEELQKIFEIISSNIIKYDTDSETTELFAYPVTDKKISFNLE